MKPRILMISPNRTIGGGEIYAERVIKKLGADYVFSIIARKRLRRRLESYAKNVHLPIFPEWIQHMTNRTYRMRVYYYRLLFSALLARRTFALINVQAFDHTILTALSFQAHTPVILTAHTRFIAKTEADKAFIRAGLRHVAKIICVSEATQKDLLDAGVEAHKCQVIHNGVDTDYFKPQPQQGEYVTWVGRLEQADKNPSLFVEIAKKALAEGSDLKFRIVGTGSLEAVITERIQAEQIHNLTLAGFVHDMREVYAQALVLCLTSTSEALPLTLLEAMSSGVPAVSTDVGGVREVITSPDFGSVCQMPTRDNLYKLITDLTGNHDRYQVISQNVRRRILDGFSEQKMLRQTGQLFKKVANKRSG